MPAIDRLFAFLARLTPQQITLGLVVVSALLLITEDRRFSLAALLMQYVLFALLVAARVYPSIVFVRVGIGLAMCLILFVTAWNAQPHPNGRMTLHTDGDPFLARLTSTDLAATGVFVRLSVAALGGLIAYGVWSSYPLAGVSPEANLAGYWLATLGLLTIITTSDPLRMGFGLITFMNGFEGLYMALEGGLLVIGLLGIIDIAIALTIAVCAESWIATQRQEEA